MSTTYQAKYFFDGEKMHENATITIEGNHVLSLAPQPGAQAIQLDGLLTPGFVDVQVNGGGGALFNTDTSIDGLGRIREAHSRFGTTAMTPTLITDDIRRIEMAADTMAQAIEEQLPGILGIHFEGPHLSKPKKGIHREHFIRPISDAELIQFCRQDLGKVIVTLAPENVPADIIRELVSKGVQVCLGHSNADAQTVTEALEAGASGFTHLFNAMSPLTSRAPGMVGAAMADENSYAGLIVDLYHVHPLSALAAIRAKGSDKIMLVTDAMAHVGSDASELPFFDTRIRREGDKLTIPEGNLAGSALDMASAVRNCHQNLQLPLQDCLKMASLTPANYLGLAQNIGKLQPGFNADMVLLNDEQKVEQCWIGGQPVLS
ncbi:N-acetylglucosamine-6-phosphate deacetylase [Lacimicrobium alkaliphilum]|uniref:N-acetylgalactosamine-6-phosphate deacetylase n=1 Tax=Lacimicrobium alkaliphilum TaxID=1526571 RepID=A0ABQ1R2G9_9ALTE|nr:N-acetylglucosamine-6-phosphate deacetylase [Lacimicrobium alkaliphilum]GGD52781.1 N-acetylgalactosamine-6-phosphate deacetylase [Lacimicrobium alkaliphilum]